MPYCEAVGEPAVGAGGCHVLQDLAQRVLLPGGVSNVRLIPIVAVAENPAAAQDRPRIAARRNSFDGRTSSPAG